MGRSLCHSLPEGGRHIHMHTHTHIGVHAHPYTCTHTYTYTHITHTNTRTSLEGMQNTFPCGKVQQWTIMFFLGSSTSKRIW